MGTSVHHPFGPGQILGTGGQRLVNHRHLLGMDTQRAGKAHFIGMPNRTAQAFGVVDGRVHAVQRRHQPGGAGMHDQGKASLVEGKQRITVRFQAAEGREIAPVFGIRTIRLPAPR